ncbi:MAG: CmcJ/NvfI family oxidoreductase [Acidimicrobiales bacterium]
MPPPANGDHVDISPDGALWQFAKVYRENFPDGPGYRRALFTSFWRTFSPPPQDWPLCMCEFDSVADSEGIDSKFIKVDVLPEDPLAPVEGLDKLKMASSSFYYNEGHRWWYFPQMTRDEVLLLKLNDSDHSHAWRVVHGAFRDTTVETAHTRESVEMRTIAFWE